MIPQAIVKGSTQKSVIMRAVSQGSIGVFANNSIGETTSGLNFQYWRVLNDGNGAQSFTPISYLPLSFPNSQWSAGGVEMLGDGYFRLDVPDAAFARAAGCNGVVIDGSATGIFIEGAFVTLYDGPSSPFRTTPEVY
jgi:hypothetical protein